MHGLFITGTDTDVGKTYVTALLARQLLAEGVLTGIYKPACSGAVDPEAGMPTWSDVETHFEALGGRFPREMICPQGFRAPAAPPVAAELEGCEVDDARIIDGFRTWEGTVDALLVEGVGGFLAPLSSTRLVADLAVELGFPVLVVAHLGLGTLNHTLLTLEAVTARGLRTAGIVLNQTQPPRNTLAERTNPAELARLTTVPILGIVEYGQSNWLREPALGRTIKWRDLLSDSVPED